DPFTGSILNPSTLHRFTYGINNPVNNVDPTGMFFTLGGLMVAVSIAGFLGSDLSFSALSHHEERPLTGPEKALATQVFQYTLPLSAIYATDDLAYDDAWYVLPKILPPRGYIIHINPRYYSDMRVVSTFIHELTHVWQGSHGYPYVSDSLFKQVMLGRGT